MEETRREERREKSEETERERGRERRFFFVLLDESGAGQTKGEGRTGSRVEERHREKEKEREGEREGERRRRKRDRAKKREAAIDDLAGREHEEIRNGDKEKMTKARGAADSIGKAGRGASFLLPAFSPYYVPYFPLFLRSRANQHAYIYAAKYTHTHITRVLFPFCPPPRLPVDLLSYPLLHPPRRSLSALSSSFRAAFVLFVAIVRTCTRVYVYTCAPCLNRRTRGFMSHGSALPRREGGFVRG